MKRNYGIDLLRVVSMFYVIILHSLERGGVAINVQPGTSQYATSWMLEILAFCAVNCFALISGYVGYTDKEKPHKYSSYFKLWMQIVFYGVVIMLLTRSFHPEWVTGTDILKTFFPVTNRLYWYFSAYTGLFLCIPLINKFIRQTTASSLKKYMLVAVLLFSFLETNNSNFTLNNGYSFAWLCILYFMGGVIKKCHIGEKTSIFKCFIGIIALVMVTWLWLVYGTTFEEFGMERTTDFLICYTSPTILGISILHLLMFSKLKVHKVGKALISFMAPCAFAIYILNNHSIIWDYMMENRFVYLISMEPLQIVVQVVCFALAFVLSSILIDRVRILIFKLLHLNALASGIEAVLRKGLEKLIP